MSACNTCFCLTTADVHPGAYVFFDNNVCAILSLQEAILVPWRSLPKKVSKLYFAMRGLLNYSVVASMLKGRGGGKYVLLIKILPIYLL